MRCGVTVLLFAAGLSAGAQTFHSVQDGIWNDPLTWDCGCVPTINSVIIEHEVTITTNIILFMDTVHVTSAGALLMDAPHSVAMTETVINDATMQLIGDVDVDGELFNNGIIAIDGDFHCDNLLFMGGAGTLFSCTNISNDGTIDGTGRICVSEVTVNAGTIQGEIDFCDGSPTTATPPIIDINSGIVAPSVTFCLTGACSEGMDEQALGDVHIWPNPAGDRVWIEGLPPRAALTIHDAPGRVLQRDVSSTGTTALDLTGLSAGPYMLLVEFQGATRSLRLVVQ